MSKLRIVYISLLIALGVLIAFTVFRPFSLGEEYTGIQRAQLLETEDEWIVEFDLTNNEGEDREYTIHALVGNSLYTEDILIPDGRQYTYIHHVRPDMVSDGKVSFALYEADELDPIKQWTFYLK